MSGLLQRCFPPCLGYTFLFLCLPCNFLFVWKQNILDTLIGTSRKKPPLRHLLLGSIEACGFHCPSDCIMFVSCRLFRISASDMMWEYLRVSPSLGIPLVVIRTWLVSRVLQKLILSVLASLALQHGTPVLLCCMPSSKKEHLDSVVASFWVLLSSKRHVGLNMQEFVREVLRERMWAGDRKKGALYWPS